MENAARPPPAGLPPSVAAACSGWARQHVSILYREWGRKSDEQRARSVASSVPVSAGEMRRRIRLAVEEYHGLFVSLSTLDGIVNAGNPEAEYHEYNLRSYAPPCTIFGFSAYSTGERARKGERARSFLSQRHRIWQNSHLKSTTSPTKLGFQDLPGLSMGCASASVTAS